MVPFSMVLIIIAMIIESFYFTNEIIFQVWSIMICYNQAFFYHQVDEITVLIIVINWKPQNIKEISTKEKKIKTIYQVINNNFNIKARL